MINTTINNESFTVVWFKRDLRLRDHQPLVNAIAQNKPLLLLYIVEPIMLNDPHMDIRHWRFIYQSITDLNEQLSKYQTRIELMHGDAISVFKQLRKEGMSHIFSHQEIGLNHTFERDKKLSIWCKKHRVEWIESSYGAVKRPLNNRLNWHEHWQHRILSHVSDAKLENAQFYAREDKTYFYMWPQVYMDAAPKFQMGGEKRAWYTLHHFFKERGKRYFGNIGKPLEARETCSRLSPYLAWGNISLKQVYQFAQTRQNRKGWKASVNAFKSRLHWHCHFIQKFESESEIEKRAVNKAYEQYPYCEPQLAKKRFIAWSQGRTGIPIIDASMRALQQTGYINFRMRAMLVSFLCHHLNVDWKIGVSYLASLFLDYEPGIHYPQFQMQAGITGTNTIRIYNPIKQSQEKDPEGKFIRIWLPELKNIPVEYIHDPSSIPSMEAVFLEFKLERDYFIPIVKVKEAAAEARQRLWEYRNRKDVKAEAKRVLFTHSVVS